MKENKVWLITGAGSGIGLEITKAALAAGNSVVATGRNASKVTKAIGNTNDSLLVVKMDVTNAKEISTGVNSAIENLVPSMCSLIMPAIGMQVFSRS